MAYPEKPSHLQWNTVGMLPWFLVKLSCSSVLSLSYSWFCLNMGSNIISEMFLANVSIAAADTIAGLVKWEHVNGACCCWKEGQMHICLQSVFEGTKNVALINLKWALGIVVFIEQLIPHVGGLATSRAMLLHIWVDLRFSLLQSCFLKLGLPKRM